MKERPILFSGPMVRAILEGRKTQTRRIMKPQPSEGWTPYSYNEVHQMRDGEFIMRNDMPVVIGWGPSNEDGSEAHKCPYGQPGDRLWVRETWQVCPANQCIPGEYTQVSQWNKSWRVVYKATVPSDTHPHHPEWLTQRWRPSIHMPRWASRLTLEIVSVRVERLQDISEADAIAEGGVYTDTGKNRWGQQANGWSHRGNTTAETCLMTAKFSFWNLWDHINGKGSWDANPWVWVIEFKVVQS